MQEVPVFSGLSNAAGVDANSIDLDQEGFVHEPRSGAPVFGHRISKIKYWKWDIGGVLCGIGYDRISQGAPNCAICFVIVRVVIVIDH